MAKIYISYSHADRAEVVNLTGALQDLGHEIIMDTEVMKVGHDFRKSLLTALRNSDGVLVYITQNSINSNYVISEIGSARAFVDESSNKRFFIPVIAGEIEIPPIIQDVYCVKLINHSFEGAIELIDNTIANAVGRKVAVEEREEKLREQIETNAATFITETMSDLQARERRNATIGYIWYVLGYCTLAGGIIYGIIGLTALEKINDQSLLFCTMILVKSLVIIGLLLACSKYSFDLGKTYMNESLRNSDRIHAISFGRFYLQAFGDRITSYEEIKDIFQNWNIDKDSAFQKLDSSSFDPKLYDKLIDILDKLANKK